MRADILKNVNAHKTLHDISYGCLLWRKDYMHNKGHLSITPKKKKKKKKKEREKKKKIKKKKGDIKKR